MKTFATSRENTALKVDDEAITMTWKDYPVWEAKAEHIKRIRFTGRDRIMTVEVNAHGEELIHPIDLPKKSYEEAKALFTEELDGVQVSSLSKKRQLLFPLSMIALVLFITVFLAWFSRAAEEVDASGETSVFRVFCNFLSEQFKPSDILLGGGVACALFGLIALKRYFFPRKDSTVEFHYGDRMMIFRNEDDTWNNE